MASTHGGGQQLIIQSLENIQRSVSALDADVRANGTSATRLQSELASMQDDLRRVRKLADRTAALETRVSVLEAKASHSNAWVTGIVSVLAVLVALVSLALNPNCAMGRMAAHAAGPPPQGGR